MVVSLEYHSVFSVNTDHEYIPPSEHSCYVLIQRCNWSRARDKETTGIALRTAVKNHSCHSGDRSNECSDSARCHTCAEGNVTARNGGGNRNDGHPKGESSSSVAGNGKGVTAWVAVSTECKGCGEGVPV